MRHMFAALVLSVSLLFCGCAESNQKPASYKQQLIQQHLNEGWIYVGISGPYLRFKRQVPGGSLYRDIPYYDPTNFSEYFRPEQRSPW